MSGWTFGRIGLTAETGGQVIPVVSERHPEINGFYRVDPGRPLREQIEGYDPEEE